MITKTKSKSPEFSDPGLSATSLSVARLTGDGGDGEVDREFLLQAAAMQDSLLQSYRTTHTTMQAILLAIGVGVALVPLSLPSSALTPFSAAAAGSFLALLWSLHRYSGRMMRDVVIERGHDVNYWQRLLIMAEQKMPPYRRFFTTFKIHQQARRSSVGHLEQLFLAARPIEAHEATALIGAGLGHTRMAVDTQLFFWLSRAWDLLLFVGATAACWRVYLG